MDYSFLKNRQKARRRLRIKLYLWIGAAVLVLVLGVWAFLKAPFFIIKEIEVTGLTKLTSEDVLDELQASILQTGWARALGVRHFAAWPTQMQIPNPLIAKVDIAKHYLNNRLEIKVQEQEYFSVWCRISQNNGTNCFWLNENGVTVAPAPDTEGALIYRVVEKNENEAALGEEIINQREWPNIKNILESLSDLSLKIKEFVYNGRLQELIAYGTAGEKLIFSTRLNYGEKVLGYIKTSAEKGDLKRSEYLDLTVENRIYLKPR
ncbi:MAG: hypothetical protein G01um10143_455 [Parcubacteria group bacterium Gr01-1014_3]|nr:MAG: hypothetical protein G01um10143_455 [Parcubacteria group bacterium Gr01-1014_3]